jgi:TonB family protein
VESADSDRAVVRVALHRDGHWSTPRLLTSSGDARLATAAMSAVQRAILAQPVPAMRDTLPRALPGTGGDSLVVTLHFGETPRAGERAVARFAVQERPVRALRPASPRYPALMRDAGIEETVVAIFVVDADGRADMATFQTGPGAGEEFVSAVREALGRSRYRPAQVDCREVPQLVRQPITFKLEEGRRNPNPRPSQRP